MRLVDVFLALGETKSGIVFHAKYGAVACPKIEYFRPGIVY